MAPKPIEIIRFIGRSSKRIAVTVAGGAVLAGGLAMLVLPGPGILVIALGFAILGTEYAWAAAAFEKTKRGAEQAGRVAKVAAKSASGRIRRRPQGGGPDGAGSSGAEPHDAAPHNAGRQDATSQGGGPTGDAPPPGG